MPPLLQGSTKCQPRAANLTSFGGGAAADDRPKKVVKKKIVKTKNTKTPTATIGRTPTTKEAPPKKLKDGSGKWWQEEEVKVMLDAIEKVKPRGSYQWDQVELEYNHLRPIRSVARDKESIRQPVVFTA